VTGELIGKIYHYSNKPNQLAAEAFLYAITTTGAYSPRLLLLLSQFQSDQPQSDKHGAQAIISFLEQSGKGKRKRGN
jgi:hypothetical protein